MFEVLTKVGAEILTIVEFSAHTAVLLTDN
jgi:hypothetical protein